jgi:hypothetical protein
MSNTDTLTTSQVQSLSFDEISDMLDSNWAEWFVSFEYNGKQYIGLLQACPNHPDCMSGDTIEAIEEA